MQLPTISRVSKWSLWEGKNSVFFVVSDKDFECLIDRGKSCIYIRRWNYARVGGGACRNLEAGNPFHCEI